MPDIHAKLCSPSGADGWFACPGRVVMEAGFPDKGSEYSDDGTARHAVVAHVLKNGGQVADLVDTEIHFWRHDESDSSGVAFPWEELAPEVDIVKTIEYREEWLDEDHDYVTTVRALAEGGELFVEQQVNFERHTTVQGDSFGTADAVILKPLADSTHELIIVDRKTGYHEVPVEHNRQLKLYALGAHDEHSLVYDISRVRLIIHQRGAREWDCSIEELLEFAQEARSRAITVVNAVEMHGKVDRAEWERTFLNQHPSEDACRYCKAMATCPSMQRAVQTNVSADFSDIASGDADMEWMPKDDVELGTLMAAVPLVEDWCKAVRAEVERRLLAGDEVPGFKLVLGKAGNRKWASDADAEAALKAMRLKVEEMYDLTLISPTSAEKLAKAKVIGPRQWPKLQSLITRADPKPSVAPASDKRDAYVPPKVEDDFTAVADEATDLA
jgi:hypothetical protein